MLIFGPVPSRRLGRSLGINNIPPKACSYSCCYCQVGLTPHTEIVPRDFYEPDTILAAVEWRLSVLRGQAARPDYLTLVPDGEPTLDIRLGDLIERLRALGIPVAVISNGSLLYRAEVRERLAKVDWVSVKVDAVHDAIWRRINRPHPALQHQDVLEGMQAFAALFSGTLTTETMLVRGLNDTDAETDAIGAFIAGLSPHKAYCAVPTRPPAVHGVGPLDEQRLTRCFQIIHRHVPSLELLSGYEGDAFASTGDLVADLLAITAVHPLRESAVQALVERSGATWEGVERLLAEGSLVRTRYGEHTFYVRRVTPKPRHETEAT
jgi:wyosine [tRNA(Phe)-imidazoG37] synthetase (radical SAM superfamily)